MKESPISLWVLAVVALLSPPCMAQSVVGAKNESKVSATYLSAVRSLSKDAVLICTSRDGRFAAVADDEEIVVLDLVDGSITQRLAGHGFSGRHSAAFSADSKYLFTSCFDMMPLDLAAIAEPRGEGDVQAKSMSAMLKQAMGGLEATENHSVIKWSLKTGETVDRLPIDKGAKAGGLAISPDGRHIAYMMHSYGKAAVRIHHLSNVAERRALELPDSSIYSSSAVSWSGNGKSLLVCSGQTILVFAAESGVELRRFDGQSSIRPTAKNQPHGMFNFEQALALDDSFIVTYSANETIVLKASELSDEYERRGEHEVAESIRTYSAPNEEKDNPFKRKVSIGIAHISINQMPPVLQEFVSKQVDTSESYQLMMTKRSNNGMTETNVLQQYLVKSAADNLGRFYSLILDDGAVLASCFEPSKDQIVTAARDKFTAYSTAELQLDLRSRHMLSQSAKGSNLKNLESSGPASATETTVTPRSAIKKSDLLHVSRSRRFAVYNVGREFMVFDLLENRKVVELEATDSFPVMASKAIRSQLIPIHTTSVSIDESSMCLQLAEPVYEGIVGSYTNEQLRSVAKRFPNAFAEDTHRAPEVALLAEIVTSVPKWRVRTVKFPTGEAQEFDYRVIGDHLQFCQAMDASGCTVAVRNDHEVQILRLSNSDSRNPEKLASFSYSAPIMNVSGKANMEELKMDSMISGFSFRLKSLPRQGDGGASEEPLSKEFLTELRRLTYYQNPFTTEPGVNGGVEVIGLFPTGSMMANLPVSELATSRFSLSESTDKVLRTVYSKKQGTSFGESMMKSMGIGNRVSINRGNGELAVCPVFVFQQTANDLLGNFRETDFGKSLNIDFFHFESGRYLRTSKIPISVFKSVLQDEYAGVPASKEVSQKVATISQLLISPDGRFVAVSCAGASNAMYLCDANTGRLVHEFPGVNGAAFISNEQLLADDRLINVSSGNVESQLTFNAELKSTLPVLPAMNPDESDGSITGSAGKSWLWFVGIAADQYAEFSQLTCAENDVEAVGEGVANANGHRFDRIEKRFLTGKDAALGNVKGVLQDLENSTKSGDTVVLMFSGHGLKAIRGLYFALPETRQAELQTTAINWSDVAAYVSRMEASRIVILLDTCHSGAFAESALSIQKELKEKLSSKKGLVIISASAGKELALEVDAKGHGACTVGVLELLKAAASQESSELFQVRHWKETLAMRVSELTADRQHPEWPISNVPDDADLFLEPIAIDESSMESETASGGVSTPSTPASEYRKNLHATSPMSGFPPVFIADRDLLAGKAQNDLSSSQLQRLSIYREFAKQNEDDVRTTALRERLRRSAPTEREFYSNAATEELAAFAEVQVPEALHQLAFRYLEGSHGLEKDEEKCVELCRLAAEQNYHPAIHTLGFCLEAGVGVGKDDVAARTCFERAAAMGNFCSMAAFGKVILAERGDDQTKVSEAITLIRRSAEQGCESGQYQLGTVYLSGIGVPQSTETGIFWLKKSAERNSVEGMMALGKLYSDGLKVPKNLALAIDYYRKAKAAGNTEAVERLKELGLP